MKTKAFLTTTLIVAATVLHAADPKLDTSKIEQITGLKGALNEAESVFKVTQPRSDVKVSVDGWQIPPFMGLTSWAAFTEGKMQPAMVMGDFVLFQDEVNDAMSAALDNGLAVTALHNHFFYDEPKVYFMHIGGEGTADHLAKGVRAVLDKVKTIRAEMPELNPHFDKPFASEKNAITGAPIEEMLGVKGQAKDGMLKVVIGRKAKMPCGCEVGKEMGVNTWAAFAGTDDNALVDGDFVVLESELQAVLKSLRKHGINIVAIHHHMTGENPRYIFLHYWGHGKAGDLAKGVAAALAQTNK
jgi:uncharacterized protein DUF1259